MINYYFIRQKTIASISLFCLSFFLVVTVSCNVTPVITIAKITSATNNVITLLKLTEKVIYATTFLMNSSYEKLAEDIRSENFKTNNKFSNDIIEKMENRHLELVTKHKELDQSLDKTNKAADELFSMIEARADQSSRVSLREESLRDINATKKAFSEKIEIAEDVSSKLEMSIKDYDNILNFFQIKIGTLEAQKYIEIVDSVISEYKLLEQEVEIALYEGQQLIANVGNVSFENEPPNLSPTPPNKSNQEEQNQAEVEIEPTKNLPDSSKEIQLNWRSKSNLTQIKNLDQICWGTSNLKSVQTVFGNKQPLIGMITIPSPKTGGCMPGDALEGNFELSGNTRNCIGTIKITWQDKNEAYIEWNISNLGSACPVGQSNWKIDTYPVKL